MPSYRAISRSPGGRGGGLRPAFGAALPRALGTHRASREPQVEVLELALLRAAVQSSHPLRRREAQDGGVRCSCRGATPVVARSAPRQ
jgi:hypothetical protein